MKIDEMLRQRARLSWHWWVAVLAAGWPLLSWLALGGISDPILMSNVITTLVILIGIFIFGSLRSRRSRATSSKPIHHRSESLTMFDWLGWLALCGLVLCTGAIGAMLFIGAMSDILRPTPGRGGMWNLTGFALAIGPLLIALCVLILAKIIPFAKREIKNTE